MISKNIIVTLFSTAVSRGVPILVLPFLVSKVGVDEYGVLSLYLSLLMLLMIFFGGNAQSYYLKLYYKTNDRKGVEQSVYGYMFVMPGVLLVVILPFCLFFGWSECWVLLLMPFLIMGHSMYMFLVQKSRLEGDYYTSALLEVLYAVWFALVLLLLISTEWELYIVAQLLALTLVYLVSGARVRCRFSGFSLVFKFMFSKLFHYLSGWLIMYGDRFLLLYFLTVESVGEYSLGVTLALVAGVFYDAMSKVYVPKVMELGGEGKKVWTYAFAYNLSGVLFCMLYGVGVYFCFDLFFSQGGAGGAVACVILLGVVFQGVYKSFYPLYLTSSREKALSYVNGIGVLINVVFNLILIPEYGLYGAAAATVISYLMISFCAFVGVWRA